MMGMPILVAGRGGACPTRFATFDWIVSQIAKQDSFDMDVLSCAFGMQVELYLQ